MKNIHIFLVLGLLLASVRENTGNFTKNNIASTFRLENNLDEFQDETTVAEKENPNDNKATVDRGKMVDKISIRENKNVSLEVERNSRDVMKKIFNQGLECITCEDFGATAHDKCYSGASTKTQMCAEGEHCFTELHPQYIKRGCTFPLSINRTFVCKCPLCNDKPSEDLTYYEYSTISDWEYDNKRLKEAVVGLDLLCKVCDTKGQNFAFDKKCKLGKSADYMQCAHNELCFTNIDRQIDFVSRGCVPKPVYNSLYFLCNETKCNNEGYTNPRDKRSEFNFRTIPLVKVTSVSNKISGKIYLFTKIFFFLYKKLL